MSAQQSGPDRKRKVTFGDIHTQFETSDKPQTTVGTGNKLQTPVGPGSKPHTPVGTGNKPQKPGGTGSKPQTRVSQDAKPQTLLGCDVKPHTPVGHGTKPQTPTGCGGKARSTSNFGSTQSPSFNFGNFESSCDCGSNQPQSTFSGALPSFTGGCQIQSSLNLGNSKSQFNYGSSQPNVGNTQSLFVGVSATQSPSQGRRSQPTFNFGTSRSQCNCDSNQPQSNFGRAQPSFQEGSRRQSSFNFGNSKSQLNVSSSTQTPCNCGATQAPRSPLTQPSKDTTKKSTRCTCAPRQPSTPKLPPRNCGGNPESKLCTCATKSSSGCGKTERRKTIQSVSVHKIGSDFRDRRKSSVKPPSEAAQKPWGAEKKPCQPSQNPCGAVQTPCRPSQNPCGAVQTPCRPAQDPCGAVQRPTKKIYVTAPLLPEDAVEILRQMFEVEQWNSEEKIPRRKFLQEVQGASAILCAMSDKIDAEVIEAAGPDLKLVFTLTADTHNIDMELCEAKNVKVHHVGDMCVDANAEMTCTLLLAAARRTMEGQKAVQDGEWGPWKPMWICGVEFNGRTLGLLGFGALGWSIASRMQPFGLSNIIYYDKEVDPLALDLDVAAERVDLDTLFTDSDFIVCATLRTPETNGIVNHQQLSLCKPDCIFVNTVKGELVNHDDLLKALKEKKIGGAALDVTYPEPLPVKHPLLSLPNCIITPHTSMSADRTQRRITDALVKYIICLFQLPY